MDIFENTDKHEVLDCSYPPDWEEFVRQVNEKKVNKFAEEMWSILCLR